MEVLYNDGMIEKQGFDVVKVYLSNPYNPGGYMREHDRIVVIPWREYRIVYMRFIDKKVLKELYAGEPFIWISRANIKEDGEIVWSMRERIDLDVLFPVGREEAEIRKEELLRCKEAYCSAKTEEWRGYWLARLRTAVKKWEEVYR